MKLPLLNIGEGLVRSLWQLLMVQTGNWIVYTY